MEGPKTIRNISQKDSASLNIKFETDCAAESGEASAQYVSGRRSSILTGLSDRRAPAQNLLDNNGVIFNQSKENFTGESETSNSFSEKLFNNGLGNKTNKIKQIIESAISPESKQTVSKILDQVNQLSIAEKLLLYLKLPTGRSQATDPLRQPLNPLGSRFEIHQTITWIKTHLEEDQDISLPKQDVYDEYIAYCDSIEMKPLSTADFGKVMKQVFPRVRPRRLGTRGNSRYCYAGMRKRVHLDAPLLPDLGEAGDNHCTENESFSAASCLIREWAEKLLSAKFDNLQDLACHLVGNLCVDSRSVAAFTLMSTLEPRRFFSEKDVIPLLLPCGGQASKHRETQLQLQRKLQEREVIREQKRKMQDNHQSTGHRTHPGDKPRVKRAKLSHQASVEDATTNAEPKQPANPTPEHFSRENETLPPMPQLTPLPLTWQNNNCDIKTVDTSTQSGVVPDKLCQSNGSTASSGSSSNEVMACKGEVSEMSQVGFSQVLPIPVKTNEDARNGGDMSKLASHAQCQNQADIPNVNDVPNKNSKLCNRSPVTNVKSRHLSLDFEPNLSHTKMSGRNSAMGHNEVLKSEKSKSSLRYYLESLPMKKPRKVPPIQDLSKEFTPNPAKTSQSPNPSPNVVPKQLPGPLTIGTTPSATVPISPPPAKVPIPRLVNPNKKLPPANLIILPPVPMVQKSPRKKYKLIQPKVESPTTERDEADVQKMGKEGSAFVSPKFASKTVAREKPEASKSPRRSRGRANGIGAPTESVGNLASIAGDDRAQPPPTRRRNEVSIGCLEKDALDDYLHGGGNSQEQEEELMQYFQHDDSPPPPLPSDPHTAAAVKLSQLRLLLERNLASPPAPTYATDHSASLSLSVMSQRSQLQTRLNKANLILPSLPHGLNYPNSGVGTRRRVSFETSTLDRPENGNSVPQSPNTRRRTFNFTPITAGPHSPLGRIPSKPSSANASPFVSPRNTPVPRSKQNSGQVSSAQSSFVASPNNNNGAQGRVNAAGSYMLNLGCNFTPYAANASQNVLVNMGQRNQNMGSYPGQKSTSRSHSLTLGSAANDTLEQLLARSLGQGTSNLGRGGVEEKSRQSMKLQRSQSVNSNTALQYLLQTTDKGETFNQRLGSNKNGQDGLESKMFAMPGELHTNSGNLLRSSLNSFPRASPISISAPQSPLVHYHAKTNPFDFKVAANSLGGSGNLLEGILKRDSSSRGFPSGDQFLAMENNILNLKSIDGCGLAESELQNGAVLLGGALGLDKEGSDESSLGPMGLEPAMHLQKADTLSQEVSRFFPDAGTGDTFQKTIPNFAQLQYRSQSVPLRRTTALVSPLSSRNNCLDFNFPDGGSMAPTPVPTEFRDFGTEMMLDPEATVQEGLNSENLSQIFNLLDAQEENLELVEAKSREVSERGDDNALNMAGDEILMMGRSLDIPDDGEFERSLMPSNDIKLESLPQEYRNTLAISLPRGIDENETLRSHSSFDMSESEVCGLEMKEEYQEMDFNRTAGRYEDGLSYPNTPLPYTSTVEYVTDASLDTFPLNALNLRSVQARLRDSFAVGRADLYARDELALPLMGGNDSVSQLEQEVDKL